MGSTQTSVLRTPLFVANLRAPRIERFLSYHKRSWENGVLPGTSQAAYFEGLERDAFKRHQAIRGLSAP